MVVLRGGEAGPADSKSVQGNGSPGRRAVVDLPAQLTSAAQARAFLAELCRSWNVPELAPDAELVVSELVENAVQHSRSTCQVSVELHDDTLTIKVRDHCMAPPRLLHPPTDQPGGRGLLIVNALSQRWGSEPAGDGKLVWAELAVT